ncbi:MAG: hypothetical protein NE334_21265 [Lentisphaeraceae bacterium]|nr:hypothetical protein [Lentisphaeraceae bacterium]
MKQLLITLCLLGLCINLLAEETKDPNVHYKKGLELLSLNKKKEARKELSKAIAIDPDFEMARFKRGTFADYKYLVNKDSQLSEIPYYKVGRLYFANDRPEDAIRVIKKGTLIDGSGIIKYTFEENFEPVKNLSLRSTSARYSGIKHLESFFHKNNLYLYGAKIADPEDATATVFYIRFGTESNTVVTDLTDAVPGEVLEEETIQVTQKDIPLTGVSLSNLSLEGQSDFSGVNLLVNDPYSNNAGFEYKTVTDENGNFDLLDLPPGKLYIHLQKLGYIGFDIPFTVKDSTLWVEDKHSMRDKIILPDMKPFDSEDYGKYEFHETKIKLYKHPKFKIKYQIQSEKNSTFTKSIKTGKMHKAGPADWNRGSWTREKTGFGFLEEKNDVRWPDMVLYRNHDGFFLGQPSFRKDFIAVVDTSFDELLEVPENLELKSKAKVELGKVYIIRRLLKSRDHFVKVIFSEDLD